MLWAAQCRGKSFTWRWLWATLSSATAGVLYAAAIVTHDQQPGHILRALPWLLIALGSAALDIAIWGSECICLAALHSRERPAACRCCCNVSLEALYAYRDCWVLVLSPVMSPFDVILLLSITYQTGYGMARLPGDSQTGAAGPVPPQPPACPLLPALHPGLSSPSSSDATSINSELEVSAFSWLLRCCFFSLGALPCCSMYVKASTP
uniref:Uncharacterized protein n=1 Tax=Strix occidentalis caurina TaxID=311401 RepID=A0A8D0EIZ3_STROC